MKTDKELAGIVMSLYNDEESVFDLIDQAAGDDDFGFKAYDDCNVVVLEGTHNIPDVKSDIEAMLAYPIELKGAGCHAGAYEGLSEVKDKITPLISKTKPLYVVGHSLGTLRAYILAAILIEEGYNVIVVVWSPLRAGDANLADIISKVPNRAYWNYQDDIFHDPFGNVPVFFPLIAEYVPTGMIIKVDRRPDASDRWGQIIGFHHMEYYEEVTP